MNESRYQAMRRPVLTAAGIDPRAVDYLLSLERGTTEAIVTSLRELNRVAHWPGRIAKLPGGVYLIWDGIWRLQAGSPGCPDRNGT